LTVGESLNGLVLCNVDHFRSCRGYRLLHLSSSGLLRGRPRSVTDSPPCRRFGWDHYRLRCFQQLQEKSLERHEVVGLPVGLSRLLWFRCVLELILEPCRDDL